MSAVGLLCRQYLGAPPRNPSLISGVSKLRRPATAPVTSGPTNIYYEYYATQVMHHMGGDAWQYWNEGPKKNHDGMSDVLIARQDVGATPGRIHQKGSFSGAQDAHGSQGGRIMQTSLSLLTLEVYYRHLPLYRREMQNMKQ